MPSFETRQTRVALSADPASVTSTVSDEMLACSASEPPATGAKTGAGIAPATVPALISSRASAAISSIACRARIYPLNAYLTARAAGPCGTAQSATVLTLSLAILATPSSFVTIIIPTTGLRVTS